MASNSFGCWYAWPHQPYQRRYFTQIALDSRTTILASTSRTVLTHIFSNPQGNAVPEVHYTFPLYDAVTVVSFKCTIGQRSIHGLVKEKQQARMEFSSAVERGGTAGLFEQLSEASDVFTTKLGNIPAGEKVVVEIVYLGELKQDAETGGVRFMIPAKIAPRYGMNPIAAVNTPGLAKDATSFKGINIIVDIAVESGSVIRGVQSPSHPIAVIMGRKSSQDESIFQNNHASASLALVDNAELFDDFVIIVNAQGQDVPRALLETHPKYGRALMTTLVPKFNLPDAHPEIVFIVDRSGSMDGSMNIVVQALKLFLKSLPLTVKFNICSFGSHHTFLFDKSKHYDESSLETALSHLHDFSAGYGGTELQAPIEATVKNRLRGVPLEIMVLTDGHIWKQHTLFDFIKKASREEIRVFSLGIGSGVSTSLVEGMAHAGNGFSQFVKEGEIIDKRVVRMLKAALTPHISNYSLEVQYAAQEEEVDDDFELVQSDASSNKTLVTDQPEPQPMPISLFDQDFKEMPTKSGEGRYDHLPKIAAPEILQAPYRIPSLYTFSRTTVYLLFGPDASQRPIRSVILRATSAHGPLQLEIPVVTVGEGETIHQLAAKKATQELEEGRGWIVEAKSVDGELLKEQHENDWDRIIEREAVRLGTQFQIAGKYCSFVAIESNNEPGGKDEISAVMSVQRVPSGLSDSRHVHPPVRSFGNRAPVVHGSMAPQYCSSASFGANPSSSLFGKVATNTDNRIHAFARPSQAAPSQGSSFGSSARSTDGGLFGSSNKPSAQQNQTASARFSTSLFSSGSGTSGARQAGGGSTPSRGSKNPETLSRPFFTPPWNAGFFAGMAGGRVQPQPSVAKSKKHQGYNKNSDLTDTTMEQRMHFLIGIQEYDGSWRKVDQLLKIVGVDAKAFNQELAHMNDPSVKATTLALAWLEANAPKHKEAWIMVADKARVWLATQGGINYAELIVFYAKAVFCPPGYSHC